MNKKIRNYMAIIGLFAMLVGWLYDYQIAVADDNTNSITINNATIGHTYQVYQLFTGTVDSTGETLSDVKWGENIDSTKFTDSATITAEKLSSNQSKLGELANNLKGNPIEAKAEDSTLNIPIGNAGYYLIKDVDNTSIDGNKNENTAFSLHIYQVLGNIEIESKSAVPSVEKKVKEKENENENEQWQDSADYSIGSDVKFKLTATLPTNYKDYSTYKLVFHDTLSSGLSYKEGTVTVYVEKNNQTREEYTGKVSVENDLTITMENLKETDITSSDKIVVEYEATLNDTATIGSAGNSNKVYLEYSNNPNQGGEKSVGQTPSDKVVVYTYQLIVNKTDGQNPLKGAGFTLTKDGSTIEYKKEENQTTFNFVGLDAGTYTLTETKTPDGYNTIQPIVFTISAEHDTDSADPKLTMLKTDRSDITHNREKGSLEVTVVNKKGSTLPSTGSTGTKRITFIGGSLILVTGVLFVTKQRMKRDN